MNSNLSGDKLRSPHVSWVFAQLVTFSISGRGATAFEPLAGGPLSRLAATALPKGEPSLASPFGGGGLALARPERATRQRPAQSRVPPPSLIPKGGTRLGRGDRKARRKPPWHRRCHQETPGEGFLRKTVHRTIFLFSCACWRYKTVGRCPTPCHL